jgi:GT2 family glycosyltransferase
MFSIIICSVDAKRFAGVKAMYESVFAGADWELIHIDDARSLAEGYNRGVVRSKGDQLIFSHDDVTIFSPDAPQRLQRHLANFDIVGVAGTDRLTCAYWLWAGTPHLFGQVANPAPGGRIDLNIFGAPFPVVRDIQAIDGLFMAVRRSVFEKISFDSATFDGFHHYDIDFSYAAFRAGLALAVANDVCVLHASAGNFDEAWRRYAQKFQDKWFGGKTLAFPPKSRWAMANVANLQEALEVMTPAYWRQIPEIQGR